MLRELSAVAGALSRDRVEALGNQFARRRAAPPPANPEKTSPGSATFALGRHLLLSSAPPSPALLLANSETWEGRREKLCRNRTILPDRPQKRRAYV